MNVNYFKIFRGIVEIISMDMSEENIIIYYSLDVINGIIYIKIVKVEFLVLILGFW